MLTDAQRAARAGKLTASRIAPLMTGDAAAVLQLYLEMIGEAVEADLSDVWPVQLGAATEAVNLRWYSLKAGPGDVVTRCGEVVQHPEYEWACCTLDGFDSALNCPIECKHVGGREPVETIVERYFPQCLWQMACTDAKQCALSIILGANAPIIEYLDRDDVYIAEMVRRGAQFMECVRTRTPPVAMPGAAPPAAADRVIDMSRSNVWGNYAASWLANYRQASAAKDAEKNLKALVPAEARKAIGHGVVISRDRAGKLSLREAD